MRKESSTLFEEYQNLTKKNNIDLVVFTFPFQENYNNFDFSKSEKLPIEFIPENKLRFKELLLERKTAIEEFHYTDGTVQEKIWSAENFTETSNLNVNVRSRPHARKGKWKELGIAKVMYKINE